jgi:hypothetical protein
MGRTPMILLTAAALLALAVPSRANAAWLKTVPDKEVGTCNDCHEKGKDRTAKGPFTDMGNFLVAAAKTNNIPLNPGTDAKTVKKLLNDYKPK